MSKPKLKLPNPKGTGHVPTTAEKINTLLKKISYPIILSMVHLIAGWDSRYASRFRNLPRVARATLVSSDSRFTLLVSLTVSICSSKISNIHLKFIKYKQLHTNSIPINWISYIIHVLEA